MNARVIGIVFGTLAFFAAGIIVNALGFPGNISLLSSCAAAYFTWRYYRNHDEAEIQQLLAGRQQLWQLPYPVAYGSIKDAIARVKIALPRGAVSSWSIVKEDDREGIIIALISMQERYSSIGHEFSVPVTVACKFKLEPDGESTKVMWDYEAHCPLATHRMRTAIYLLEQSLKHIIMQRHFQPSSLSAV